MSQTEIRIFEAISRVFEGTPINMTSLPGLLETVDGDDFLFDNSWPNECATRSLTTQFAMTPGVRLGNYNGNYDFQNDFLYRRPNH
jgi:hypothetical protein